MTRFFVMALVILFILGFALAPSASAALDEGLVLYYSFDTDFSAMVADESGNCNNGTPRGGAIRVADGACDAGYYLDGIDDDIRVPNVPSLNPANEITVAAWFKCAGLGTGNALILLKGAKTRTSNAGEYGLVYFQNNPSIMGKVSFSLRTSDSGWWQESFSDFTLSTGVWYYVVGTYKPGEWNLYVNGARARETVTSWQGTVLTQDGDLYIGADRCFPDDEFFKGNVDEVRIYNRCLSAAEVSNLYLRCQLTDGVVQPVELPYLVKVGFSNLSEGDQDVTEFYQDETIYIRVRDVDIEDTGSVRIFFQQPRSRTFSVTLTRNSDGTYTGSIPARRFKPGKVTVQIMGARGWWLKLMQFTELTIRAASFVR